jgi:hypothetical protein
VNFFEEVRKLSTKGMDPKSQIIDVQVIIANIVQVFGNVNKL